MPNGLEIRLVSDPAELYGVYRTRYDVYVEELKWQTHYADAITKTLSDRMDETGNIFGAFIGDEVVGTLRTHHSSKTDLGSYIELYQMQDALRRNPRGLGIATMLMVRSSQRGTRIASDLMSAAFEMAVQDEVEEIFIECEPKMVRFYAKLGFHVHASEIFHPEYGSGVCLSMAMEDCLLMKRRVTVA